MVDSSDQIKIINGPPQMAAIASPDYLPREGEPSMPPEEHFGFTFFTNKPVKHLTDQIELLKPTLFTLVKCIGRHWQE